ncbi:amidase signature domain-containing protein [Triangularia verruculosa]|uniref:Amidase signature domain-containing protein n=1 Tax=Triangularia verruculosa TaxID=2587418 RepID=A0AAN7AY96_9PEZI|nr:amidase signature domain-containing protein [Triangularia verruculosa]
MTTVETEHGGLQYLIHPQRLGTVSSLISKTKQRGEDTSVIVPVTGLTLEQFNCPDTFQIIENFNVCDDVWVYGFNETIVILDKGAPHINADGKYPQHRVYGFIPNDGEHLLDPGPYFIYNGGLHQAWRLYPDTLCAFNFGIIPRRLQDPHISVYDPVTVLSQDGIHKAIAVPSRLYYPKPTSEKPLSGVRFVIDDVFSVEGIKTTMSNEAWTVLESPSPSTSHLIKKLVELGAVIVGKTKTSQFGVLHTAWVDVPSPKNPRADGYQEALGSAPGAGSAIAGYGWVDCAVAMDTLSGVMETAEWYGLFALRLSHYWPFCAGMSLACPQLSAATFLSLSLERVRQAAHAATVNIASKEATAPNAIISLTDAFQDGERCNQRRLAAAFANLIEAKLPDGGVEIDLGKRWECRPSRVVKPKETLEVFMRSCAFDVYCYDFAKRHAPFVRKYIEKHKEDSGKLVTPTRPYWDDAVDYIWEEGNAVSDNEYEDHSARLVYFRKWFDEEISTSTSSPGAPIVILPTISGHTSRSRVHSPSQYAPTSQRMQNWDECLSSILQRPQLVLPIGRTWFKSTITNQAEVLPLCASLMGGKDCDLQLIELAAKVMYDHALAMHVYQGRFLWGDVKAWQEYVTEDPEQGEDTTKTMDAEVLEKVKAKSRVEF